jgi:hypothetical protein
MRLLLPIFVAAAFSLTNCSSSVDLINSHEVSEYDNYVAGKKPELIFQQLESRANEPFILGGEDVTGLTLTTLSLFKNLGDKETLRAIQNATESQRSAIRLFVKPDDLDSRFLSTRKILDDIPVNQNWPAMQAERTNSELDGS